jgi:transcriptional regulator with XRE-family HTH domain
MPVIQVLSRGQVRAARAFLGWSIRDLAKVTGLAINTVSRFENGAADAQLETLIKIQDALQNAGVEFPNEFTVSYRQSEDAGQG